MVNESPARAQRIVSADANVDKVKPATTPKASFVDSLFMFPPTNNKEKPLRLI